MKSNSDLFGGGGVQHLKKLDRDSPIPLYHQLESALLKLIGEAGLGPSALIPSENQLADVFEVTRPTVRQALDRLVRSGVLRRERGRGTYVVSVPRDPQPPSGSHTAKVIMPSLDELIHLRVLEGTVNEARSQGLLVVLAQSDGRFSSQERELEAAAGFSGVLLWPVSAGRHSHALQDLRRRGQPLVFLDRYLDRRSDHVVVDDEAGASEAVDHLIELGHRRIAFVYAEQARMSSVRLRRRGYQVALAGHQLDYDEQLLAHVEMRRSQTSDRSTLTMLSRLFAMRQPPTAAFCANDTVAVGLVRVLERNGFDVPQDFSVAGFDALETLPGGRVLTSVRRATDEMGRVATGLLAARIRSGTGLGPPQYTKLPTDLIVGDTTSKPPGTSERRGSAKIWAPLPPRTGQGPVRLVSQARA